MSNVWQLASDFVRILFRRFDDLGRGIHRQRGRYLVVAFPMLWLGLFFLAPLLIVLKISFTEPEMAQPPYTSVLQMPGENPDEPYKLKLTLSTENYQQLMEDELYRDAFLNSLKTAAISTILALILGFPMAYGIARARPDRRLILLMMVVLPFWTSSLLRTYAWLGLLKDSGIINNTLMTLGVISEPLRVLNTDAAVYLGLVYSYLPFMVLPLVATLVKLDNTLLEAAAILARHHRRKFAGVYSHHGRIRDPRHSRRPRQLNDRPRTLERILQQHALASCLQHRYRHADFNRAAAAGF